jgi:hypothetical protein
MQQGRVTLEADWNEGQSIFGEELRQETLEIVGPAGTPDKGYQVMDTSQPATPYDFSVGPGTMYVGGVRVELDTPVNYLTQPEWLDHTFDPDWVDPSQLKALPSKEFVYLFLREQEVSAVEDYALRDVALGGPDTAARTRIIQHIVRLETHATDCADALAIAITAWAQEGLKFDPTTMRLLPQSTLRVTFPDAPQPDPCEPETVAGYLGADNQLIRIQISDANKFVWGFDDASFLYRVDIGADLQTVHLQSRPVDSAHQPQANQAVEVLRSAARLSNGEYVASATGVVETLTASYSQDTQTLVLPTKLPPQYADAQQTPRAFLRVWQQEQQFTAETPIELGTTGIYVTLNTLGGAPFHVGDYWLIAARPSTPQQIYPERYLADFQPPDGPREWVCPLAIIAWNENVGTVVDDCRNQFDNLVALTQRRCCTITLRPEDVTSATTLNVILDKYKLRELITVCFMPGIYMLPEPLRLGPEHSNLTLEACHDGVVIQAAPGAETKFLDGLIVLNHANNVTLRGLRFELPQVPFVQAGGAFVGLDPTTLKDLGDPQVTNLNTSIGLRPLHCANLTIKDCLFRYSLTPGRDVLGVGIFAGSECWGLKIEGNRFVREEDYLRIGATPRGDTPSPTESPFRMLIGYALAPTVILAPEQKEVLVRSLLQDASFRDNLFAGLTIAALVFSDSNVVVFEDNTVRECYVGYVILPLDIDPLVTRGGDLRERARSIGRQRRSIAAATSVPLPLASFLLAVFLVRSYPLPREFDVSGALKEAERPEVPRGLQLALHISGNTIDAFVPNGPSGIGLWVEGSTGSMMTLSANKMRSRTSVEAPDFDLSTALINNIERCAITGNLILNEGISANSSGTSLILDTTSPAVVITGNVFQGTPTLPTRPATNPPTPPPMDTWLFFNTVV